MRPDTCTLTIMPWPVYYLNCQIKKKTKTLALIKEKNNVTVL